jgi:hypothetical protein
VEPDNDANHRLYGKTLTATNIVRETDVQPTVEGKSLVAVLDSKLQCTATEKTSAFFVPR